MAKTLDSSGPVVKKKKTSSEEEEGGGQESDMEVDGEGVAEEKENIGVSLSGGEEKGQGALVGVNGGEVNAATAS